MVHKNDERIQELEVQIRKELESLGIIGLNFYFGDAETSPRVEYQVRDIRRNIRCKELRESLRRILTSNILDILNIHWKYDSGRGIYFAELELPQGFRLDRDLSKQHGLFSLAYGEVKSHRMRYKV